MITMIISTVFVILLAWSIIHIMRGIPRHPFPPKPDWRKRLVKIPKRFHIPEDWRVGIDYEEED